MPVPTKMPVMPTMPTQKPSNGGITMPNKTPAESTSVKRVFGSSKPQKTSVMRTVLYGGGGVGKTTTALYAPGKKMVIDLDKSIPVLYTQLQERGLLENIDIMDGIETWEDVLGAINQHDAYEGVSHVIVDTMTKAQELCERYICEHTRTAVNPNGYQSLEEMPFQSGFGLLSDEFLKLFTALDRHIAQGRNVILICHDCAVRVPNPAGQEYQRWEPRLSSPKNGKGSITLKLKEWCDNMLFVAFDISVEKGKAKGNQERHVYPIDMPWAMAKTRVFKEDFIIEDPSVIWQFINS